MKVVDNIRRLSRSTDPDTSHEAAEQVDARKGQAIVLDAFKFAADNDLKGLTEETLTNVVYSDMGIPKDYIPQESLRKRRADLVARGFVERLPEWARNTKTGRRQHLYKLTFRGMEESL